MITDSRTSLCIYGQQEHHSSSHVTQMLQLRPDRGAERGEPRSRFRMGRDGLIARQFFFPQSFWALDATDDDEAPNADGLTGVRQIIELLRDRKAELAELAAEYDIVLWWDQSSNGTGERFVLQADLIADLAWVGCTVMPTVYLNDGFYDDGAGQ